VIWEYQGPQAAKPAVTESQDILLEMERLLYEDLREELIRIGTILLLIFILVFFITELYLLCLSYLRNLALKST